MATPHEHRTEFYLAVLTNGDVTPQERNDAARHLFERLLPDLRRELNQRGRSMGVEDLEDAVGDLCLTLVEEALNHAWTDGASLRAYLTTCARNLVADHFRARRRHRGADAASGSSDVQRLLAQEPDKTYEAISSILSEVVDQEMHSLFRKATLQACQELDEGKQEIVRLAYEEHLKPRAIGNRLGVRPSHVATVTFHYRCRVREIFLDLGGTSTWARKVSS
jgi:RNA polymerase sigma factor (sigma-70 family)